MDSREKELKAALERLEKRCAQHRKNRENVAELLTKADERRTKDPEHRTRWNQVIENLEFCLDEAKARLASCEASILRMERRLRAFQNGEPGGQVLTPEPEFIEHTHDVPAPPGDVFSVARHILKMPLEEMGRLTLDAVAALHAEVAAENAAAAGHVEEHLIDLALPAEHLPELTQNQRKQQVLRGAIEKIQKNQIATLTDEENRLVVASYEMLAQRSDHSPKNERLKRILGAAVNILVNRRQAAMRRAESEKAQEPHQ